MGGSWFLLDGEGNVSLDHGSVDKSGRAACERMEESHSVYFTSKRKVIPFLSHLPLSQGTDF